MKISNIIIGCLLLGSMSLSAQVKQEVGVSLGGGMSTLNYKQSTNQLVDKMGYNVGFTYTYFLTNNWGIKSGLELSKYHAKSRIDAIQGQVAAVDDEMENFEYRYSLGGYTETQNIYFLNIPIMFNFQTDRSGVSNFYSSLGFKFGIPVSSKYKTSISSISAEGYYPSTNVVYDDLLFRGFGTFSNIENKGNVKSNIQATFSAEFGIKNKVGEKLDVYTGVYFDYGLNNMCKSDKSFIEYNIQEPLWIHSQSVLNSKVNKSDGSYSLTKNVHTMALGIKVNVAFEL